MSLMCFVLPSSLLSSFHSTRRKCFVAVAGWQEGHQTDCWCASDGHLTESGCSWSARVLWVPAVTSTFPFLSVVKPGMVWHCGTVLPMLWKLAVWQVLCAKRWKAEFLNCYDESCQLLSACEISKYSVKFCWWCSRWHWRSLCSAVRSADDVCVVKVNACRWY